MNSNTVCYRANLGPDGALDTKVPVEVKWINYEKISAATGLPDQEGLLFIEKPVYGVDAKPGTVDGGTCPRLSTCLGGEGSGLDAYHAHFRIRSRLAGVHRQRAAAAAASVLPANLAQPPVFTLL